MYNRSPISIYRMKTTKELARELGLLRRRSSKPTKGLKASRGVCQPFSYLVVIDFESTCWKEKNYRTQEVIEFPAVLLNTATGAFESEFHYYVQPCEQPTLSDFCKQLTGISQGQVEDGIPLSLCMKKFGYWIDRLYKDKGVLFNPPADHPVKGTFVTWSDWDLGVCLQYECRRKQIMKPAYLNSWIDIRATYRNFYDRKPHGLNGALQDLGITFAGREHSGVDDARNTARLAWRMMCDGCVMNVTKSLNKDTPVQSSARPIDTIFQRVESEMNTKSPEKLRKKTLRDGNQGSEVSYSQSTVPIAHGFKRPASPHGKQATPRSHTNIPTNNNIQKRSRLSKGDKNMSSPNRDCSKKLGTSVVDQDSVKTVKISTDNFRQGDIYRDNHSPLLEQISNSVNPCVVNAGTNEKHYFPLRDTNKLGILDCGNSKVVNSNVKSSSKTIVAPNKENLHPGPFMKPAAPIAPGGFRTPCLNRTGAAISNNCMKTPVSVSSSRGGNPAWSTSKATPPLCKCGKRSKLRFVQSPGPNQGRCFFGCSVGKREGWSVVKRVKTGCDFFKWESSLTIGQRHFTPLPSRNAMSTGCIQRQPARASGPTPTGKSQVSSAGTLPLKRCLGMQTPSVRGNLR